MCSVSEARLMNSCITQLVTRIKKKIKKVSLTKQQDMHLFSGHGGMVMDLHFSVGHTDPV